MPIHALWLLLCGLLLLSRLASAEPETSTALDCAKMDCRRVLPKASAFEPVPAAPYVEGRDAAGQVVGWVGLSTDLVDVRAYSGKPLITLVGLDPNGVITGAAVLRHSEPILLVGIPERKLHELVAAYSGKSAKNKIVVGDSNTPGAESVDIISGATVTTLAQNQTIIDTARAIGRAVGVIDEAESSGGHFVHEPAAWTWDRLLKEGVFGRLTVTQADMGRPEADGVFIDLWFTIADAAQVGTALLDKQEYDFLMGKLEPGEHLVVVFSNGESSFKGSGFVRGGIFDRVRIEQGLRTITFTDKDYRNLPQASVDGAPRFKEGAVFIARRGALDPGLPFDLVFTGSRYNHRGGFSRNFKSFTQTHRLPQSVYASDKTAAIWEIAWRRAQSRLAVLGSFLTVLLMVFAFRRWTTASMRRLRVLHTGAMVFAFAGLGLGLRAQPSVTQLMTLVESALFEWRWELFLSEPLLFVFWCFIALVTLVWGRGVFCGWACPYGALSELLFKLGRVFRLPSYELPEKWHKKLRYLRYVVLLVLVGTFIFSAELGELLAEVEPFKSTFFVAPWTRPLGFFLWWAGLLLAALFVHRPFCRYLCPLGAGLALPSSFRLSGPHRREFCKKCQICARGCEPRAIDESGKIDPRECLSCMECEANYRDPSVCPPLIGIAQLTRKRTHPQLCFADETRMERLKQEAKPWRRRFFA